MPNTGARVYAKQTAEERRSERRARLLDAGLEAFGTRGYAATAIEHLCAEAAVSTRTFYEELGSREALLIALHDSINDRAVSAVIDALATTAEDDLIARAHAGARAYFRVMTADARFARIAVVETVGVSATVEQARRAALDRFAALIDGEAQRLATRGLLPRRDHSLTAHALVGAILELVNTWRANASSPTFVDDVTDEAARLIVAALTAPNSTQ
jgi:AcrR family transcriptional regulator